MQSWIFSNHYSSRMRHMILQNLLLNIFIENVIFFSIICQVESKKKCLFEINIFCNIINSFLYLLLMNVSLDFRNLLKALSIEVRFMFCLLDFADAGYNGSSSGPAGVWWGECSWIWIRPAAPWSSAALLRLCPHGCHEHTGGSRCQRGDHLTAGAGQIWGGARPHWCTVMTAETFHISKS